mmetsp:Transcript_20702/g.46840  ORF Transcript_20702/g.46840 Transcript_20702/m.46840 type:complete len:539 (+) Transcript_20702:800-2416(+)
MLLVAVPKERLAQPLHDLGRPPARGGVPPVRTVVPPQEDRHRPRRVLSHGAHRVGQERLEHRPQVLPRQVRSEQHQHVREDPCHCVPLPPVEHAGVARRPFPRRAEHVLPHDHPGQEGEVDVPPPRPVPGGERGEERRQILEDVEPYRLVGVAQERPLEGQEEGRVGRHGGRAEEVGHGVHARGEAALDRERGLVGAARVPLLLVAVGGVADEVHEAPLEPVGLPVVPAEQEQHGREAVRAVHPHLGVGRLLASGARRHGDEGGEERGSHERQVVRVGPAGGERRRGRAAVGLPPVAVGGGRRHEPCAVPDDPRQRQRVAAPFEDELGELRPRVPPGARLRRRRRGGARVVPLQVRAKQEAVGVVVVQRRAPADHSTSVREVLPAHGAERVAVGAAPQSAVRQDGADEVRLAVEDRLESQEAVVVRRQVLHPVDRPRESPVGIRGAGGRDGRALGDADGLGADPERGAAGVPVDAAVQQPVHRADHAPPVEVVEARDERAEELHHPVPHELVPVLEQLLRDDAQRPPPYVVALGDRGL